ncbi:MAG: PAS domain-containing protein [Proteobacteria bacterium]|nr:PAS domain-containing protein [Pseudomonadota bacterium]MBU1738733.1 PAS domain-containing protein [Pseudomonadota bacterium]
MKKIGKLLNTTRLAFISPWLLATAVGLLLLIISIFAATNLHRGKTLLTQAKFQKGMDLIRFVGAGARASTMSGTPVSAHIQQLIEQTANDDEIVSISVINGDGKILAHSNPDLVGKIANEDIELFGRTTPGGNFRVVDAKPSGKRALEVFHNFNPFRPRHGRMMRRNSFGNKDPELWRPQPRRNQDPTAINEWCRQPTENGPEFIDEQNLLIKIALDMEELDKLISRHRVNIVFISMVLLLVGLGGWLSLLTAQGYRVSQKTLEHMQAFMALLVSKLPDGIVATDSENRVISFNETMTLITGMKPGELIGRTATQSLPEQIVPFFRLAEQAEVLDRDILYIGQNGQKFNLLVSSVPIINNSGLFTGRVLLVHDITRLKKLESEISRNERFIALGKMAAGVAHEVRNPLSSIKGFATLIGSRFPENSEEYHTAQLMISESERLNRSISALLNYARPAELDLCEVNIGNLVRDSLQLVDADAGESGVEIIISNTLAHPVVTSDPDRLKQILLNLVLNSLQAMPDGGTLTVSLARGSGADEYKIQVQDTGCGIAEKDMAHVTDPYFTTRKDGTGLGLSLALKNIEELGGNLEIQSEVGSGTCITITLPVSGP